MMRIPRPIRWTIFGVATLLLVPLCFYYLVQGRPFCHKQIMIAFDLWVEDNGMAVNNNTNPFPNVGGIGADSLASIREEMNGYMPWATNYRYVPGLRQDDPGDLVLMYFDRPTRWVWHGPPHTRFEKKKWIVVPVDFTMGSRTPSGPGEPSETISTAEFKQRLRATIDFVRTNQRPNWQVVVAEHTKFLQSVK